MVPVILLQAFGASNAGAFAIIRALAAATRGLRVRLVSSVILIVAGIGGAFLGGAKGAAWGLATASFCTLLLWWHEAHRAIAVHRTAASRR
jgi:fucose permease